MLMKSTTRARSPFVALVVLALLFTGISAIAYPALSSDADNDNDADLTNGDRYLDSTAREGWSASSGEDGTEAITIRGIGGFVFSAEREPVQGATITLKGIERSPLPPERPDPNTDPDDEQTDRPVRDGVKGETDRVKDTYRKNIDLNGRKTTNAPIRESDVLKTSTDRTGAFEFLGLERGMYHLQVYVENRMVYEEKITYSGAGSTPMRIVIREREETKSVVVVGIVVNEKREPVPGAHVELVRHFPIIMPPTDRPVNDRDPVIRPGEPERPRDRCDENGNIRDGQYREKEQDRDISFRMAQKTATDREGKFGFRNISPGTYTLVVQAKGYEPAKQLLVVRDDTRTKVLLKHVRQDDKKEFKLHATVVDGDKDGQMNDVVIKAFGENKKPIGGVMIYIDGEYVGATSYQGWLRDLNYRPGTHRVHGEFRGQKAATQFTVRGERPDYPPRPEPEYGYLKGTVYSDEGPIARAVIEIFNDDFHSRAISGREGEFAFERLPVGEYHIHGIADGYYEYGHEIFIEGNGENFLRIHMEVREEEPPVEKASIRGSVVNEEGRPIYHGEGFVVGHHEHLDIAFETMTQEDGTFFFRDVPAGIITLEIIMEGYHHGVIEVEAEHGEVSEITVMLEKIEENPVETGKIHGAIVNEDGEIIPEASGYVLAHHEDPDITIRAQHINKGVFHFEDVPAGMITLEIRINGHDAQTLTLEVLPGDVTRVTIHP
jgi:hypothetical protein